MTESVLDELGFYALAGQPTSSRDLVAEVVDGEAMGLGTVFISERYNKKEAATLSGAAGAVSERIHDPDRRHQPQHPPPDGHRRARPHDAEPHRRPVRPRARPRHPARCRTPTASRRITTAQMEDFAGLMRRLFRGEVDHRPRRARPARGRSSTSTPRSTSTSRWASSPSVPRRSSSPGAASTRSCCTPSSPTRRRRAACRRSSRPPRRPGATRRRSRSGRASPPSATTSPRTGGS